MDAKVARKGPRGGSRLTEVPKRSKRSLCCMLLLLGRASCFIQHNTLALSGTMSLKAATGDNERGSRTWQQSGFSNQSTSRLQPQRSRERLKTKPMPVTGYDARAIEEYYDIRPLQVGWRLNSLGFPLLGKWSSDAELGWD